METKDFETKKMLRKLVDAYNKLEAGEMSKGEFNKVLKESRELRKQLDQELKEIEAKTSQVKVND